MSMDGLQVSLFGRLSVKLGGDDVSGLDAKKSQELFAYLLVYRTGSHSREVLAELLWGDRQPAQSRKYLRQALWQLQSVLETASISAGNPLLDVDPEWVRLNSSAPLWLDVVQVERAYAQAQGVAGSDLTEECAYALEQAVQLYRGDFLEGCYQDWCIFERERLQNIYLAMLDKLTHCCETQRRYEAGLAYGTQALRYDRARERTHRRMMRLHYLAGDRTAALRQFDQLVATLKSELNVKPSHRTIALWEQIRADRLDDIPHSGSGGMTALPKDASNGGLSPTVNDSLDRIKQLHAMLASIQRQVRQEIEIIELAVAQRTP